MILHTGMKRKKFVWGAAACVVVLLATPVFAQSDGGATPPTPLAPLAPAPMTTGPVPRPASRPAVLVPLYVSFAALQVADAATTLHNVHAGASEVNPLMGGVVGSPAAFVATKMALGGVSIFCAEKLWKRHRAAAIALMVGLNGLSATIVARNYATGAGR